MQAVGGGAAAASYTRSRTMAQGNRCRENSPTHPTPPPPPNSSFFSSRQILSERATNSSFCRIVLTGLSLQAFSMCVFTFCLFRFDWRLYKLYRMEVLLEERNQWHDMTELHSSLAQKLFHGALAFSTLCLVARCAYRVAELSHGWLGPLAHNGPLYIVFEGAMVLLATITMLVFHPVWIYPHPTRQGLPEPPLERPWVPRCLRAWARRRGIASAERIVVPAGINIDLSGPVASHAAEAQNRNQLSMFGAIPAGNQPSRYVKQPTLSGQPSLTVDDMFFLTSPLGNSGAAGSSRRR